MLDVVVADRDRVGVAERGARATSATLHGPSPGNDARRADASPSAAAAETTRAGADRADDLGTAALDAERRVVQPARRRGGIRRQRQSQRPRRRPRRARGPDGRSAAPSQPVTFSLEHHGDQPLRDEVRPGSAGRACDAELGRARRIVGVVVERAAPRRRVLDQPLGAGAQASTSTPSGTSANRAVTGPSGVWDARTTCAPSASSGRPPHAAK